jgi:DNA-binding transcriptional LysR family regulator
MAIEFIDAEWNDLKIFLAVARSGTQAFAAELLGQSQPTVGRRIRALERSLGSALFYRDARGLGLTDEGMAVLRNVERMETEALSIRRRLSVQNELAGLLRVAASGWLGSHLLTQAIADFSRAHPDMQIHLLSDGNSCNLVRREVDVVYQLQQFGAPDIVQRPMMRVRYGIYASAAYLDSAGPVSMGGYGHKLVALPKEAADANHVAWLQTNLGQASTVLRSDSHEVLLQWCRNGIGLAMLPHAVGGIYPDLQQVRMSVDHFEQTVWAGYHIDMKFAPRLRSLIEATQIFAV